MRRKRSSGRVALALLPSMGLALAGCTTMTGTGATEHRAATLVACQAFRPIDWSTRDTPETIIQVKGHNAAYGEVCDARH